MDICLYASHYGTSGATRDGYSEEMWSKPVVETAVALLRQAGFTNVYTGGITGHEMDQHQISPNLYDICISNHFNSGNAMLLYNANRNNPHLNKLTQEFNGTLAKYGIVNSGAISRPDLAMLNSGNAELYLLEWADCNKPNELAWLKDTNSRARDLANLVKITFLDGSGLDGETPKPVEPSQPSNSWGDALKGVKFGDETILDAYDETGTFYFTNAPSGLSIYPEIDAAMEDRDAYAGVEYYNGESVEYWGVIRTNKYDYIIYTRDNGQKGVVSIRNKTTGLSYGYAE